MEFLTTKLKRLHEKNNQKIPARITMLSIDQSLIISTEVCLQSGLCLSFRFVVYIVITNNTYKDEGVPKSSLKYESTSEQK